MRRRWDLIRPVLAGVGVFAIGFALFGCAPTNSPVPEDDLPVPQEEPVTPP